MVSEFSQVLSVPWAKVVLLTVCAEGASIFESQLASGSYYRTEVDPNLLHLQPYVSAEPQKPREEKNIRVKRTRLRTNSSNSSNVRQFAKPGGQQSNQQNNRPNPPRYQVSGPSGHDDESEDLTAEDLRRLRGEIPLSSSSKKKWKH